MSPAYTGWGLSAGRPGRAVAAAAQATCELSAPYRVVNTDPSKAASLYPDGRQSQAALIASHLFFIGHAKLIRWSDKLRG